MKISTIMIFESLSRLLGYLHLYTRSPLIFNPLSRVIHFTIEFTFQVPVLLRARDTNGPPPLITDPPHPRPPHRANRWLMHPRYEGEDEIRDQILSTPPLMRFPCIVLMPRDSAQTWASRVRDCLAIPPRQLCRSLSEIHPGEFIVYPCYRNFIIFR